jgi:hypothetical protein
MLLAAARQPADHVKQQQTARATWRPAAPAKQQLATLAGQPTAFLATERPAAAVQQTAAPAAQSPAVPATEGPAVPATEGPARPATEGLTGAATEAPAGPATQGQAGAAAVGVTGAATEGLTVPEGFEVERVAGPPLVNRPIVADFDEEGRLYVADSSGSNDKVDKQLADKPHRIVRLEDTDGDGRFDKSVVFADAMMFPEGTMWLDGSLYVAAPPSIWKLTDTDDDGVADRREEWFNGKTLTNCANDLHGPYVGPDGLIYWCKGAFAEQTYERPGRAPFVTRASHIFRRRAEGGLI